MTVTLTQPRCRVVLEDDAGELTEYVVQTSNRDAVRFDITRGRKGWPAVNDAPMLWMTFCAWSAMSRGKDTGLKLDEFLDACVEVQAIDADGNPIKSSDTAGVQVDPTQPVPGID